MAIAQQQKATDTATANANDFRAAMSAASARDHARFEAHLRDDVTFINPMVGTVDKAGFRAFHTALWTGLPDINYKVERTVSEGDTVVGECTVPGRPARPPVASWTTNWPSTGAAGPAWVPSKRSVSVPVRPSTMQVQVSVP